MAGVTDVLKTVEGEIALFRGVIKHRPIGMSKHWCMLGLATELSQTFPDRPPSIEQIWSSLVALYDFRALDETEDSYVISELEEGPISLSPETPSTFDPLPRIAGIHDILDKRRWEREDLEPSPPVPIAEDGTEEQEDGEEQKSDSDLSDPDEDEAQEVEEVKTTKKKAAKRKGAQISMPKKNKKKKGKK